MAIIPLRRPPRLLIVIITLFTVAFIILQISKYITYDEERQFDLWRSDVQQKVDDPSIVRSAGAYERENATLFSLVRNSEVDQMVSSMKRLEASFNHRFQYPWTFFNDEQFSDEFISKTTAATNAKTSYHVIPKEHWEVPDFIHPQLMTASRSLLNDLGVQYSQSPNYYKMCRWFSGFFYKHPEMLKYRYYWRIEPDVQFFCDIKYDVFKFMREQDKVYGFTINVYDEPNSISQLWPTTLEFLTQNPEYIDKNSAWGWLTDAENRPDHNYRANGYSTCHFWSNFEIGDLDFFRGIKYDSYFSYLDEAGGFFYERWGDAPVHSIGVALFAPIDKIHWFEDIGYNHVPFWNCPKSTRCPGCPSGKLFAGNSDELEPELCLKVWLKHYNKQMKQLKMENR